MAATARSNGDHTTVIDRKVVDFDALLDEARAGDPPEVVFSFKGTEFTISPPLEWSDELVRLQASAEGGNMAALVSFAEELLGDQYVRFYELGGSAIKLNRVLDKLLGVSVGESSAS